MKQFKGTIFLAVVALAMGAFAVYQYKKGESSGNNSPLLTLDGNKKSEALSVSDISEVRFSSTIHEDINGLKLIKKEGRWHMASPVEDQASEEEVTSYLQTLAKLKTEEVDADGQEIDFSKFGLDVPRLTVEFDFSNGKSRKLQVGQVRSFDQGYYLRLDESKKLYKCDSGLTSALTKDANSFRNKKLNIQPLKAQSLAVWDENKKVISLKKDSGRWINMQDPNMRLDQSAVHSYLTNIQALEADGFFANDIGENGLTKFGLNNPDLKIEIDYDLDIEKSGETFVLVTKTQVGESVALHASQNKPVYKIGANKVNNIKKSLSDFRDKKYPFQFDREKVGMVELAKSSGNPTRIKKNSDLWDFEDSSLGKVNQDSVKDLIASVEGLSVNEFAGKNQKLNGEIQSIRLLTMGGEELLALQMAKAVSLKSKKSDDAHAGNYMAKSSLSDELFYLSESEVDSIFSKKLTEDKKQP